MSDYKPGAASCREVVAYMLCKLDQKGFKKVDKPLQFEVPIYAVRSVTWNNKYEYENKHLEFTNHILVMINPSIRYGSLFRRE